MGKNKHKKERRRIRKNRMKGFKLLEEKKNVKKDRA